MLCRGPISAIPASLSKVEATHALAWPNRNRKSLTPIAISSHSNLSITADYLNRTAEFTFHDVAGVQLALPSRAARG